MTRLAQALAVVAGAAAAVPALAWNPGESFTHQLPSAPDRLLVADLNGGYAGLAINGAGITVVHPATGRVLVTSPRGGVDVVAHDIDGDKWQDLLVCAPDGLHRVPLVQTGLGAAVKLTSGPCAAFAPYQLDKEGGFGLVTAGAGALQLWKFGPDGKISGPEKYGSPITGDPIVQSLGMRFAATGTGDQVVVERSEWGNSSFATGGVVGGLVMGPQGWTWTLPEAAVVTDVTRRRIAVAPKPGRLWNGDLDGDGGLDLIVEHADIPFLGIILASESNERLVPIAGDPAHLQVVDLDADRCGDLVLTERGGTGYTVIRGDCTPRGVVATPATPATPPVATPPEGTADVPAAELVAVVRRDLNVTAGWDRVDLYVGQKLEMNLLDPEENATSYAGRGGPRGLVVRPDGRVTYTALPEHVGRWRVSVRMWGGPTFVRRGGFELAVRPRPGDGAGASLMPDADLPPMGTADVPVITPPLSGTSDRAARPPVDPNQGVFSVKGCIASLGGAFGGTDTSRSWQFIGQPVKFSGSPAMSLACEGGRKSLWWFAGIDTAPAFIYIIENITMRHLAAATIGLGGGSDRLHVGVYGSAGILLLGFGARAQWMPFETKGGLRHGFDLRATWFPTDTFAMEGMVMYSMRLGRFR